jgi:hypothetical protein
MNPTLPMTTSRSARPSVRTQAGHESLTKTEGGAQASRLKRLLDQNPFPAAIANHTTSGRALVGQLVLACGHLGEVVDIARSQYGYESYLVRYVGEAPLPEITEDWHVAQHVRFLADLDYLAGLMLAAPAMDAAQRQKIARVPAEQRRQLVFQVIHDLWIGAMQTSYAVWPLRNVGHANRGLTDVPSPGRCASTVTDV